MTEKIIDDSSKTTTHTGELSSRDIHFSLPNFSYALLPISTWF